MSVNLYSENMLKIFKRNFERLRASRVSEYTLFKITLSYGKNQRKFVNEKKTKTESYSKRKSIKLLNALTLAIGWGN